MKKICCFLLTVAMIVTILSSTVAAEFNYDILLNNAETAKHAVLDFESIDLTSTATINAYNPLGAFYYGYGGNADGTTLETVNTDKGKSLRIKPWVLDPDEYSWSYSNVKDENGTIIQNLGDVYDKDGNLLYTRNTMLYPQAFFDFKRANYIYDTAYFKTSFQFEDANFASCTIKVTNYYTAMSVAPNGDINVFGRDSGLDFAIGDWFDIEGVIDLDTGYYAVSLSQEGNSEKYEATGFVVPVDITSKGAYTSIYRLGVNFWNRSRANDWSIPTSMIIDDMQFGPVSKLNGPIFENLAFDTADDISKITTTGGTATIVDESLKITGAEAETASTMNLPFVNTNFRYSADINISDMTADRSLVVQNQTGYSSSARVLTPVEIVRFGKDGKLYIGNNEISGVEIAEATYKTEIIFDQANYVAKVKIIKGDDVVAEDEVALGTKKSKIINIDWNISAAAGSVTILDNISINTLYTFEIDSLTSVSGKTIPAADDVEVKFTNPIDISSFTSTSVKVNDSAFAGNITKVDDWTVKLSFDKDPNGIYEIDFINVKDITGATATTAFTVNTERQDLVISDVSFSRGGQPLGLATAGTVTATFDAKAYNGKTFDMLFLVGMYQGGKLVDAVFDDLTVGATKESHALSVTVPNDGKYYVVKAFVWDKDTFKPYKETKVLKPIETDQPVAIVKLDDLTSGDSILQAFERAMAFGEKNNIKMSFGLIGQYLDNPGTAESRARILAFYNNPLIELWSHGYSWRIILGNATDEEQAEDFRLAHETAAKYGITYKSFGPPSGSLNAYTGKMLNKYNFKVLMSYNLSELEEWGLLDESNTFTTLHPEKFNLEPVSTGNTRSVEELKEMWLDACENGTELAFLQVHPNGWSNYEGSEQRFYDFLLWLKARGVVFMTMEEYADYISVL